jgi:hypothetical protein
MSLGYIFIKCDDGKWYRGGALGEEDWFLCFDEDEPPEIVIKKKAYEEGLTPQKVIEKVGLNADIAGKIKNFAGRCFTKTLELEPAIAVYLRIYAPPPAKWIKDYDKVCDKCPDCEGTFYNFENVPKYIPKPSKAEWMLMTVKKKLAEYYHQESELRTSEAGVPHLVVSVGVTSYSVCYFGRTKSFRIFYPYPCIKQRQCVANPKTYNDVLLFFKLTREEEYGSA